MPEIAATTERYVPEHLRADKAACERARWPEMHRDDCGWCRWVATGRCSDTCDEGCHDSSWRDGWIAEVASGTLETATRAVLRHHGHSDAAITAAEATTHESAGCEREGFEWNCHDENGEPRHPLTDELSATAEDLRVAFESVGVAI